MTFHGRIYRKRKTRAILNAHARHRAEQRYGLAFTKAVRNRVVAAVQAGTAEFVRKQSNNRSVWTMELDGKTIRFVYDNRRHTVVTFIPLEDRYE